jgi:methionine-rich copper-binding protein CopC
MKTLPHALPALVIAVLALTAATAPDTGRHFGLSESSPEAGATVSSPSELRLRFTQEPREGTIQIRLVEAEDAGVHVMDAAQDGDEPTVFHAMIHGTLPAGTYTVSWRGMGDDGHVVRDTYQFTVSAQ